MQFREEILIVAEYCVSGEPIHYLQMPTGTMRLTCPNASLSGISTEQGSNEKCKKSYANMIHDAPIANDRIQRRDVRVQKKGTATRSARKADGKSTRSIIKFACKPWKRAQLHEIAM
mmetsp:Transcript_37726/g.90259  ORF Transcript_37726/g.90259 Transcript_37726/m.90259 type:complete len:117 (-) Transcript_37726:77-427(-)